MAGRLRSGHFRERITFKQKSGSVTLNARGQDSRSFTTYKSNVPARATRVTGGEIIRGRQIRIETQVIFETRYWSGIDAEMRIVWDSGDAQTYGLLASYDPYGDGKQLWHECARAA